MEPRNRRPRTHRWRPGVKMVGWVVGIENSQTPDRWNFWRGAAVAEIWELKAAVMRNLEWRTRCGPSFCG